MTTERFPARRAGTMVCGHPIACMYRWKAPDGVHKYCVACLFEKSGLKSVDELLEEYKKEVNASIAPAPDITPPEEISVKDSKDPEVIIEQGQAAPKKKKPSKKGTTQ